MKQLHDKVAVITGAAEGIGRAIAEAAAAQGMKLVLADIHPERLAQAAAELEQSGAQVLALPTDVSQAVQMDALADAAFERFGRVHLLVNNAGVAVAKSAWETTEADWKWVMGVNLDGVTHALGAFLPRMLAHGEEGHVVNVASVAGLIGAPAMAAYNASKFAVVGLTEGLQHDLTLRKSLIKASVLCPAWVKTRIAQSERARPAAERSTPDSLHPISAKVGLNILKAVENGKEPAEIAAAVLDAVHHERFYILTHEQTREAVARRTDDILQGRPPTLIPF
jgi:NAD(P)-dependent dehydrogenase (short-subunit alcohol dehydrogenase family)